MDQLTGFLTGLTIGAILASLLANFITQALEEIVGSLPDVLFARCVIFLSNCFGTRMGFTGNWSNTQYSQCWDAREYSPENWHFRAEKVDECDQMDVFTFFRYVVFKTTYNRPAKGEPRRYISIGRSVDARAVIGRWRNVIRGNGKGVFMLLYSPDQKTLKGFALSDIKGDISFTAWTAIRNSPDCQKRWGEFK